MKATVEVIMFFQVKTTAVDAFAAARVAASAACGSIVASSRGRKRARFFCFGSLENFFLLLVGALSSALGKLAEKLPAVVSGGRSAILAGS